MNLMPEPWSVWDAFAPELTIRDANDNLVVGKIYCDGSGRAKECYEWICLARKAYAILLKRHWEISVEFDCNGNKKFNVPDVRGDVFVGSGGCKLPMWDCPFKAIVEADEWYTLKENKNG